MKVLAVQEGSRSWRGSLLICCPWRSLIFVDPFVFVICQHGAERPLKQRALATGVWRLAFSRPGLLTLKYVGDEYKARWMNSPLVRLSGVGMGPVKGELAEECFEKVWALAAKPDVGGQPIRWDAIHVFERDRALPGAFRFEPGPTELCQTISSALGNWLAARGVNLPINQVATTGQKVLNVILSEPHQWFIGYHTVSAVHESWPGGVPPVVPPAEMVSRAYLKIAEALMWSQLPIRANDPIVEIGSAPGGASQRLLDMGLSVTGIDAAEMDERIAAHPRFEHWRSKAAAVKRKLYRKFKWLVCDANVAPNYTLDIIGDIVNYEGTQIEGMLLTFKLSGWEQMDHLGEQLKALSGLGFSRVEARQLAHNRRELCVVAQR